ncbi:MAG: ABC-F family ATP-binding cassette domain-containing protein [Paludibacteraceae bacterium]|nr:ABC-F family ATP-binding cassette domain-containing protein [Paludibacteraceae bacterium]
MATVTPYLLVENLTKSVGSKVLFSNISFAVNKGQRIALIARNGIGKSTLLNILMGITDYDNGKITWRKDLKVKYLPQRLSGDEAMRLLGDKAKEEDFKKLSGGQQKKLLLQQVLDDEPDILLLDEPTNHLDLDTVVWLEEYLRNRTTRGEKAITILMVTHDRYFLDSVCTDIFELDEHNLYTYHGNYAYYIEKRAERLEAQQAEVEKARNLYRTELEWMRRMPQARAHKAQYRIDNFYELEKKAKQQRNDVEVQLAVKSGYIGNKIFEAKDVCKTFISPTTGEEKVILQHFNYVFSRYEKLGIIGNNGTGKSTFIKLLLGEVPADSGTWDIGSTVRFGYYAQTGLPFDEGKKVIDLVRDIAEVVDLGNGQKMTASQFLQMFLFSPSQQYDFVGKLSGGERQRLHLCTVLMRSPNFLILDEPTNDLDIPTLNVLEDYLQKFQGCLIVISHDRYFMDRVVDHIFVFHGQGHVQDFPGNYTQYRLEMKEDGNKNTTTSTTKSNNLRGTQLPAAPQENKKVKTEQKRRLSFKEKKELEELETRMPALEEEKATLEALLSGGATLPDDIARASQRYQEVQEELDMAELRWLELSEFAE